MGRCQNLKGKSAKTSPASKENPGMNTSDISNLKNQRTLFRLEGVNQEQRKFSALSFSRNDGVCKKILTHSIGIKPDVFPMIVGAMVCLLA